MMKKFRSITIILVTLMLVLLPTITMAEETGEEGPMLLERILAMAIDAIAALVGTILIALLGYGVKYLQTRSDSIKNATLRDAIESALLEAENVAKDAIFATQQVFVENAKAKSEDGKLTKEEAVEAMNIAINYFLKHITTTSAEVIEKYVAAGKLSLWVRDFIEAKLGEMKAIDAGNLS